MQVRQNISESTKEGSRFLSRAVAQRIFAFVNTKTTAIPLSYVHRINIPGKKSHNHVTYHRPEPWRHTWPGCRSVLEEQQRPESG
jgi:hypothetical protein